MNIWQRFKEWVTSFFKKKPEPIPPTSYADKYEDIDGENITATISNALASKVYGDSDMVINGEGKRAELLQDTLNSLWEDDMPWITAQAFGKGGMVLVPTVTGGEIVITAANQERLFVTGRRGRKASSAVLLAESVMIERDEYQRWINYVMDENGTQTIQTVITDAYGVPVPFATVPAWESITPEVTIGGTDRLLLGFIRCPRDNRLENKSYGVPITYGAQNELLETVEHYNIYRREILLSRKMLGLPATMWKKKTDTAAASLATIDQVKRTVQDDDTPFIPVESAIMNDTGAWQTYSPEIRVAAMETRMQHLYRRLEKACSLSSGILTEHQSLTYANKDEVRAAQYDTFAVITAMRKNIEAAMADVAYAVDVLAERFGLTPAGARGNYEISFDWDYSMIESTEQSYKQLSDLQTRGGITLAHLTSWVTGDSLDDAQGEIEEAKADAPPAINFGV